MDGMTGEEVINKLSLFPKPYEARLRYDIENNSHYIALTNTEHMSGDQRYCTMTVKLSELEYPDDQFTSRIVNPMIHIFTHPTHRMIRVHNG
jgi:hypothetical protein